METNKTNSFTSASTIFSEVSIILFRKGIVLFNKGNIHEAHLTWEKIWKKGDNKERKNIKGFIQLSGAFLNYSSGKNQSGEYLLLKAKNNIQKAKCLPLNVVSQSVIDQIDKYLTAIQQGVFCPKSISIII